MLTKSKHLMTLKIKDKKKLFGRSCILDNFISRENLNYKSLFAYKGSGSGIFPDPDPGDPKRPDPDPQHCRIEIIQFLRYFCCVY